MTPFSEHHYTAPDGIRTYYRRYPAQGDSGKTPVICLHGLTRNSRDFEDLAPIIAEMGRTVVAVDVRGRGRSDYDAHPENYTPATYVQDVIGILDDLGWSKVISIGTSMGGLMTMILSTLRPGLLSGVVMNDIGPELDPTGLKRIQGYVGGAGRFANWEDAGEALRAINGVAFPKETGQDFWIAFAKRTCRAIDTGEIVLDYDANISKPVQSGDVAPPDLWPFFESLKGTPLLLVRGAISDLLAMTCVEDMARRHGGMELAQVPDVGHAPLLTEPEALGPIRAFLNRLD
ncbi:alpha/beta fold hydrolase [Oceanicaulis sp. LC35]|uniref:alpha/beta fold hydrolase n=1 Tax=Oceanicaulis sp. LC35 TaxID=3349635 RepID=UPI003F873D5C